MRSLVSRLLKQTTVFEDLKWLEHIKDYIHTANTSSMTGLAAYLQKNVIVCTLATLFKSPVYRHISSVLTVYAMFGDDILRAFLPKYLDEYFWAISALTFTIFLVEVGSILFRWLWA